MKINWRLRLRNINFWLALVPAALLLVQVVASPLGYEWDFGVLNQQAAAIINAAFGLLAVLGIATDPTTPGVSDSARAMHRNAPSTD